MREPEVRKPTPLPPRPASSGSSAAVDATYRLLAALLERDFGALEAELDSDVCSWWTQRGRISSIEGAAAVSRALVALLERAPPTRFDVRVAGAGSCVTSSLVDDALAWSLEVNVAHGRVVGAYVRGADRL